MVITLEGCSNSLISKSGDVLQCPIPLEQGTVLALFQSADPIVLAPKFCQFEIRKSPIN